MSEGRRSGASGSPAEETPPSPFASLRSPIFRAVWLARLVSSMGTWMQVVASSWLMALLADTPEMVALVQTAAGAPVLLLSLPAGVLADVCDRRRLILAMQWGMLATAALLTLLTVVDLVTPVVLLALIFTINAFFALGAPATQTLVTDVLPRREVAGAIALNAASFNLSRAIGPAVGGMVVAAGGPFLAFLGNTLSFLGMIFVLTRWRPDPPPSGADPVQEGGPGWRRGWSHGGAALAEGLVHIAADRTLRHAMVHTLAFGFATSAVWALLPVMAKFEMGGGPLTFGLLLSALGAGSMAAVVALPALRRLGGPTLVLLANLAFVGAMLVLASSRSMPVLMAGLVAGGAGWLLVLTVLNSMVQLSAPPRLKARAVAASMTAMFGGLVLGSWLWGQLAGATTTSTALVASAVATLLGLVLTYFLPLPDLNLSEAAARDGAIR